MSTLVEKVTNDPTFARSKGLRRQNHSFTVEIKSTNSLLRILQLYRWI